MRVNLKNRQYFTGCKIIAMILVYRWELDLINLNFNRKKIDIIDIQVFFSKYLNMSLDHSHFFISQSVCIMT